MVYAERDKSIVFRYKVLLINSKTSLSNFSVEIGTYKVLLFCRGIVLVQRNLSLNLSVQHHQSSRKVTGAENSSVTPDKSLHLSHL